MRFTINAFLRAIGAVLLLSWLGACAVGDKQIPLTYPPGGVPDPDETEEILDMNATPVAMGETITIMPFGDIRENKSEIGDVGWQIGIDIADATTLDNVAQWVETGLEYELQRAGFAPVFSEVNPGDGNPVISGDVLFIEVDSNLTYTAEVEILVRVMHNGSTIMSNRYRGEAREGINWGSRSKTISESLALALQKALVSAIADMNQSLRSN